MNSIAVILAVGLCFAVGQALQCYKCPLGFWDLCITTKTTCESGEVCYNGVGGSGESLISKRSNQEIMSLPDLSLTFSAIKIKTKGCIKVANCNTTERVTFGSNTTFYALTKTCCNTDLCNMAPGLPGASGLSLAAVTLFYLLVANLMA
ncbi:lymphocyte antigen 6G6e-like [Fundulus diaphanus]